MVAGEQVEHDDGADLALAEVRLMLLHFLAQGLAAAVTSFVCSLCHASVPLSAVHQGNFGHLMMENGDSL